MAAFNKFDKFVADVANGIHHLNVDTLKLMLTNVAPVSGNTVKADITEITAGNGYVAGGQSVSIASSSQTSGLYKLIPSPPANVTWTASGGSIASFRYVVIYNTIPTTPLMPLIAWWDTGSTQTITAGNSFTANLDATNGILQLQ
jgi:hypothetical protein